MNGVVACVNPIAAEEGAKVLESGGNAFDAAIATAFVQTVVSPFSCGIGGFATAHIYSPARAERLIVDGCLRAGSLVSADMWAGDFLGEQDYSGSSLFDDNRSEMGYSSICTPGAVAVFDEVWRRFTTMEWSDLLKPAIGIARNGFPINRTLALDEASHRTPPVRISRDDRIRATSECARLFLAEDGKFPSIGFLFKNPDYADTLERLAERGAGDFYRGDLAATVAADLQKNGAFVTRGDLRDYSVRYYPPFSGTYGPYRIDSNGPPGGGPLLIEALNVLDGTGVGELRHSSPEHLALVGSTLQHVHHDRRRYLGDPEVIGDEPGAVLVSNRRADQIRQIVLDGGAAAEAPPYESTDTTHLSVVDGAGNIACLTHSLGQSSGVVTPGLGFVYNNGMNRFDPRPGQSSSLAPGKARLHLMMPTIAYRDDRPALVLGAPGGNAILSALTQVFINVVEFGMSGVEAVSAPRIHAEGTRIWCESRIRSDARLALQSRGHEVILDPSAFSSTGMALAQLIVVDEDGDWDAASDPRGEAGVCRSFT
jgi:gamma-glutamyltranspeptidase/glutathione hydrolase